MHGSLFIATSNLQGQQARLPDRALCRRLRQTFEGIDLCGKRLAEEVREYVSLTPGLERISVIGHSMGGLISRYVIGAPRSVLQESLLAVGSSCACSTCGSRLPT
jgi:hypothetical protein